MGQRSRDNCFSCRFDINHWRVEIEVTGFEVRWHRTGHLPPPLPSCVILVKLCKLSTLVVCSSKQPGDPLAGLL